MVNFLYPERQAACVSYCVWGLFARQSLATPVGVRRQEQRHAFVRAPPGAARRSASARQATLAARVAGSARDTGSAFGAGRATAGGNAAGGRPGRCAPGAKGGG